MKAWRAEFPQAEQTVLQAADAAGAVVVFPKRLYSYGPIDRPMTEDMPRAATVGKLGVRTGLLNARAASSTPTVSVAATDFFGPHVLTAHAGERMVPAILAGKTIRVLVSLDAPHSFTYVPDLAAAMITAAGNRDLWNSVLHAPTGPAVTQRQLVGQRIWPTPLCSADATTPSCTAINLPAPSSTVKSSGTEDRAPTNDFRPPVLRAMGPAKTQLGIAACCWRCRLLPISKAAWRKQKCTASQVLSNLGSSGTDRAEPVIYGPPDCRTSRLRAATTLCSATPPRRRDLQCVERGCPDHPCSCRGGESTTPNSRWSAAKTSRSIGRACLAWESPSTGAMPASKPVNRTTP